MAIDIDRQLKEQRCWPTRMCAHSGADTPVFRDLSSINLASYTELEGLLDKDELLDERLASSSDVQSELKRLQIPRFTLNSAIRLRCAGEDGDQLATNLEYGERNYYYRDFPDRLRRLDLQKAFAASLDACSKLLSKNNLEDLRTARTTMTADGDLQPVKDLVAVPAEIWDSCPVLKKRRLHSGLAEFPLLKKLTKPYDLNKWIVDVAMRSRTNQASPEERNSLYRIVKARHGDFSRKVVSTLRDSPVLRDKRGNWACPAKITPVKTVDAGFFEPVLSLASRVYAHDRELADRLGFRKKITGHDILEMARHIERGRDQVLAVRFMARLPKHTPVLTKAILAELSNIAFVPSSARVPMKPPELHIGNKVNLLCLGDSGLYAEGDSERLLVRLGCHPAPMSETMIHRLARARDNGQPIRRAGSIYLHLVAALKREHCPTRKHEAEQILWNGYGYSTPMETLLGGKATRRFSGLIPVVASASPNEKTAYISLGVRTEPERQHWKCLLDGLAERYTQNPSPLSEPQKALVLDAYHHLGQPDNDLDEHRPCFLGQSGRLYSLSDIKAGKLLWNDDSAIAAAIKGSKCPVDFALEYSETRPFYEKGGVVLLSHSSVPGDYRIGQTEPGPRTYEKAEELGRLQNETFLSAIDALAHFEGIDCDLSKVEEWKEIKFVAPLERKYVVGGFVVLVPREYALLRRALVLQNVKSQWKAREACAWALAALVTNSSHAQGALVDRIFKLLLCEDADDIGDFLTSRNVPWKRLSVTGAGAEAVFPTGRVDRSGSHPGSQGVSASAGSTAYTQQPGTSLAVTTEGKSLPPMSQVVAKRINRPISPPAPKTAPSSGGAGGSLGSGDSEWDKAVGRRGEEIVLREERTAVKGRGFSPRKVVWVSGARPQADHDIRSVDSDGRRIYIEVKSTTGTGASFPWTTGEFKLALAKRENYYIYRVYLADSETPVYEVFRDPIGLLLSGQIDVDFDLMIVKTKSPNIRHRSL